MSTTTFANPTGTSAAQKLALAIKVTMRCGRCDIVTALENKAYDQAKAAGQSETALCDQALDLLPPFELVRCNRDGSYSPL